MEEAVTVLTSEHERNMLEWIRSACSIIPSYIFERGNGRYNFEEVTDSRGTYGAQ